MQPSASYFPSPLSQQLPPSKSPAQGLPLRSQRLTVIGGGSGCNAILSPFQDALKTTFIVPVSDDGGSTAEILRVLGQSSLFSFLASSSSLISSFLSPEMQVDQLWEI